MGKGRGCARHTKKRRPPNVLDAASFLSFPCKGRWANSPTNGETFDCDYEPLFACGECLLNGGPKDPRPGKQPGAETLRKLGIGDQWLEVS